jgi:N-acetylneuraminic acid mutarotase
MTLQPTKIQKTIAHVVAKDHKGPSAAPTTIRHLKCNICSEASFASRNQLFRHIKDCAANANKKHKTFPAELKLMPHQTLPTAGITPAVDDLLHVYLYVTGGRLRGRTLGSVERYSLHRKCWEDVPSMLHNRGSHGAVGVGSQLFILGGGGFDSNLATCEVLHTTETTMAWKHIASMTTFRHALSTVYIPETNHIYAIGGWENGSTCSSVLETYDVASNQWVTKAPMHVRRRLLGATAWKGKLFVFGGYADNHVIAENNDVEDVHDVDDTSQTTESNTTKPNTTKTNTAKEKIVWTSNVVESYDPETDTWTRLAPLPIAGPCSAVTMGDSSIFVLLHGHSSIWLYCPYRDTYMMMARLPLPEWNGFDATVYGRHIYVHGGASRGKWSRAFYRFDCVDNTWQELPSMKQQRRRCAAALVKHDDV